ncbi:MULTISPECIES: ATP synthase F1 subunit epsilon [unclassified Rhodosalinus]|uniref:ATP synthase F1 subunit epsilon n=1 Tax=unclassified Rhodosalinus TaxID=2630183 RepID=UPI0035243324
MADTMQFDLVSPERRLASLEAQQVQLPGADGQMTAMPNHAPVITSLRPGIVTVTGADGQTARYAVTGGFAELSPEGAIVLAERAYKSGAENRDEIEAALEEARTAAQKAPAEQKDAAELFVADLAQLMDDMV